MRYSRLSSPTRKELAALSQSVTIESSASSVTAALADLLFRENSALIYVGPTVVEMAGSPHFRLFCEEMLASRNEPEKLKQQFLLAAARIYLAGGQAMLDSMHQDFKLVPHENAK